MIEELLAALPMVMLYAARSAGVIVATPGLNIEQAPGPVRALLPLGLGLALFGAMGAGVGGAPDPLTAAGLLPLEFALGLLMGFAVRLIFAAVEVAGEYISVQMGYGAAAIFDPTVGSAVAPPTRLLFVVSSLVFFSIDGHHQVILALAGSYRRVPAGGVRLEVVDAEAVLVLFSGLFEAACRLALPILAVVFIINVVLGVLSRFAPQVNVFMLGFVLTMGLGMAALVVLMPSLVSAVEGMMAPLGEILSGLLR